MAAFNLLLLAAAFLSAQAFPQDPLPYRNTIFDDEKLEGGVFQYVDQFNDVALYTRSNNPFRLPTSTRPQHYDVLWAVQISSLTFSGEVNIQLYATQPNVDEIIIHAHDLNITSLSLTQGSTVIPIQYYTLEPEYHFLRIKLLNSVLNYNLNSRVIYDLSISFEAPLRTDMYGIYQSWFRDNATNPDGQISWMASTQFQATAARFAFPCYDEPSFKATFNITIRRPTTHKSWSCTRQQQTVNSGIVGYEDDIYYPTPVMSTYLLALIVAEYETQRFPTDTSSDLMYEVIARPNAIQTNQGDYAFNVGIDLLAEMSNHTDYDFFSQHPFLKMTQAAIPDFGAGAMENWGLLTYREAYLMYDPEHTNGYFQQLIAYILSHEIAHMWFGNLVTCDWWDTLWLNEGFARYYQYFLTHWVEEHMGLGIRFITEQMHTSLLSDSSNNPHPLTNPGVGSPASVSAMFSTISYNKGAAIIRMTEHLLGFNVHRQGLRNYLIERQFDTAQPIHLFQALQTAAVQAGAISEYGPGFNVIDYYRSWTEQGGHPVLNVDVDHQTGLMTIYQRRFNINSGYATAATNWIVPITFSTASNPNFSDTKPSHVINEAISVVNRGSVGDEWVIFNKQQTGYYRVNYDDYTWNLNILALRGPQRTIIHEFNRAQIVNDVFQFARSGIMTYNRAFNIISFLENETEYTPWVAGITGFNWIRNRIIGSPLQAGFEQRLAAWATTAMNSLTYYPQTNDETFMRSYLRYMLAPFMCNLNVAECRTAATQQFQDLYVNGTEVPVDSRNWVYCNALRDGSPAVFDFLWQRFLTHNVYTEKILLLQVLGCTPHQESLYTFLDAIVQENYIIRPQDYTTAFNSAVTGNEGNTQLVFQYIQNNYESVTKAFGSPNTPLSYISSRLRTIQSVNEFQQWVDNNSQLLGTSFQAVRNGAENSRSAIAWASTVEADINSYLTTGNSPVQLTTPEAEVVVTLPTVAPPPLNEPSTPTLPEVPDSANTSALSMLTLVVALIAKFALL